MAVGGPRLRALLALLALNAGRVVTVEGLVDGLYEGTPPAAAGNAIQALVSRLRHLIGDDAVVRHPSGYELAVGPDDVDARRFERLAAEGRQALATGDPSRAAAKLREALGLWRGTALADVGDAPFAPAAAAGLAELRLRAAEDHADAELALGGHRDVVAGLRELVEANPLRERLVGALMRALYGSGRQAEALAAYEECRRRLAEELGADPSAALADVHMAVLRADPELGGVASPTSRLGLPAPLTPLVGRAEELARVGSLLDDGRLVTLTGAGGTGKTRLAIEAAGRRPGDVCFVELAPLGSGAEVPQAVLSALGIREIGLLAPPARPTPDPNPGPGPGPEASSWVSEGRDGGAVGRLAGALGGRRVLLVLDNCEHVVDAAARLADRLLALCPGLTVLATSREALAITGEALCPVPPLKVPPAGTPAAEALGYPAVRLFADRASAVRPGFAVDEGTVGAVLRICRELDGMPLAIELAAARLRSLTPGEVASRLDDRFRLLSRGSRTAQPRHRTLRAVVEWSWDLLGPEEQALARRMTVFAGGCTLAAVERVCGVPGTDTESVLASLVDKSLVEPVDDRYRMLDTIHAFCAERLAEAGESEVTRRAHLAYFLDLARTADPHLRRAEQLVWLRLLDRERDNLHAALHRAAGGSDTHAAGGSDTNEALRLLAALTGYWWLRGLRSESVTLADELLATLGEEPPKGLVEEYALCVLTAALGGAGRPGLAAHLDTATGIMRHQTVPSRQPFLNMVWTMVAGPPDPDTIRVLAQVADQATDDPWTRAFNEFGWGLMALMHGDQATAERRFTAVLADFRTSGDRWGTAQALTHLADVCGGRGDHDRAATLMSEALELAEQLDSPVDMAELLCRRGGAKAREGDVAGARDDYERAAELGGRAGTPELRAAAGFGLGQIARFGGDLPEARRRYEAALAYCQDDGLNSEEIRARLHVGLGWVAESEGDAAGALALHQLALTTRRGARDLPAAAYVAEGLAGVAVLEGEPERAAALLGAGAALRGSPPPDDPDVLRVTARCRAMIGDAAYDAAYARGGALTRDRMAAIADAAQPALTIIDEHLSAAHR
ncbi:ATP-binding protein [Sphaerisporangium corydalis]|uniref:ATP-binding protein n=1 Tax=Sphaerisporangium corydalis TaxID=1441875 RepID=A0ABV9EA57_9ACTN|nr:BTAD domain-containing putative transcriptional regulator [Sphaerisporangium corydalis]